MIARSVLLSIIVFVVVGACTAPKMQTLQTPDIPDTVAPFAGPQLERQPLAELLDFGINIQHGVGVALPLPRTATIGLAITSPDVTEIGNRDIVANRVFSNFIKRKVAVTDLTSMPDINVHYSILTKQGVLKEEKYEWSSTMDRMLAVADVVRPDYVLKVDFQAVRMVQQQVARGFIVKPQDREAYASSYENFRTRTEKAISDLERARNEELSEYAVLQKKYQDDVEKLDFFNKLGANLGCLSVVPGSDENAGKASATAAKREHEAFQGSINRRLSDARNALSETLPPDEWYKSVTGDRQDTTANVGYSYVLVKLISGDKGTTLWQARLAKYDEKASKAFEEVVNKIIDILYERGGLSSVENREKGKSR